MCLFFKEIKIEKKKILKTPMYENRRHTSVAEINDGP